MHADSDTTPYTLLLASPAALNPALHFLIATHTPTHTDDSRPSECAVKHMPTLRRGVLAQQQPGTIQHAVPLIAAGWVSML
jgi:hypothetical protein